MKIVGTHSAAYGFDEQSGGTKRGMFSIRNPLCARIREERPFNLISSSRGLKD